ncbi:hypothetical protein DFP83_102378 [Idiomarina fontislapidosi]|uniref:Uncharacterized protein n=1 Tax=Idiomarina fontislapidosi TaxID=263723 RepID=A0A432Y981_9GAMM|nr:hypothetical protein [Idiomarina fontislapidosi]PYE34632.1 hypothetical protein DFP83_102378 [Idiomarina fontislapidosi]RUO57416.1 hypothetical protein CWE25_02845 [Idiomarina fontislapidosi]
MINKLWRNSLSQVTQEAENFQKHVSGWQQDQFLEINTPVRVQRSRAYWRLFATDLKALCQEDNNNAARGTE